MAVADMVVGGTITSSPGETPTAPIEAISPDVLELTATACREPNRRANSVSNWRTTGPPSNASHQAPT